MPGWVRRNGSFHEPNAVTVEKAVAGATAPLRGPPGDLEAIRNKLYEVMWDDVGIIRDAASLRRADGALDVLEERLDATGVGSADLAFNLTWHDWLNLKNLLLVSKAIRASAVARDDSRGAHYRSDFHEVGDLDRSRYTCVNWRDGRFETTARPVEFTRVKPGETLLKQAAAA